MSLNEMGYPSITAAKTPLVIIITSSTGNGDAPDNASSFFADLRHEELPDHLSGVQYTVLGLGDSNYTRFMHVPRVVRNRWVVRQAQL
jgi:sulfite reductase alpha subunit-like flavoprotein